MATTKHNKIKLREVNRHLVCRLCRGYYVDATTIAECLHSFCRSCIIKYLEKNSFCPICEVQIHKTKPYLSLRLDKALQDVVYKVVPGLYHDEMRRRREFYSEQKERLPCATPEQCGLEERIIFSPEDSISLSLEYLDSEYLENETMSSQSSDSGDTVDNFALSQHLSLKLKPNDRSSRRESQDSQEPSSYPKRYLQCPAVVNVGHLKKFVRMKHELHSKAQVDIIHKRVPLPDHYTLMDVAYIYTWKRSAPLRLFYQIYKTKKQKVVIPTSLPEAKNTESHPLKDLNKEKSEVTNKLETSSAVKTSSKVNKSINEAVSNSVGKFISEVHKTLNDLLALKPPNVSKSGPDNKTKETAKPVTSVNQVVKKEEPSCGKEKAVSPFKHKISDKMKLSDKMTLEIKSKTEKSNSSISKVRRSSAEEVKENKLNNNQRLLLNPVSGQLEPVPLEDYSNSALGRVEDKKDKTNSLRKEKESKKESPGVKKIKESKTELEIVKKEKINKKDSTDLRKEKMNKKESEIERKEKIHKKESGSVRKEKVNKKDSENIRIEKEPKKEVEHVRKEKEPKKEVELVRKEKEPRRELEHVRKEKEPRREFEPVRKAIDQKKEFEHIRRLIEQKKEVDSFRKEDDQKKELEYVRKAIEQRKEFELLRKVIEQKQDLENSRKESEAKKEVEHLRKGIEQRKEFELLRKEKEQKKEVEHVRRENERRQELEHVRKEKEQKKELENIRKAIEPKKELEQVRRENEQRKEAEHMRKEKEQKKEVEHIRKEKEQKKEAEHMRREKEQKKEAEHMRREKEQKKEADHLRREKEQKKEAEHTRRENEQKKEAEHMRREKEQKKETEHMRKEKEQKKEAETMRREKEQKKEADHLRREKEQKKEAEHMRKEKEQKKEAEHTRREKEQKKEADYMRREKEQKKEADHIRREKEQKKELEHIKKEKEQKKELEHIRKEKEQKKEVENVRSANEPKKEAEQVRKENESKKEAEQIRKENEPKKEGERIRKEDEQKKGAERVSKQNEQKKEREHLRDEDKGKKMSENLMNEKEQKREPKSVKKDELENGKKQIEPNKEWENKIKEKEQKGDSENLMKEKELKKEEESEKKSNLNILKSFRKEKQLSKETKIELKTSNGSTLTITALPRTEKASETETSKVSTEVKEENVYEFDGSGSPEKNDIFTKQPKHSKSKYLMEHRDKWLAKEAAGEWMTFQEYREMLLKENNAAENVCTRAKRKSVPNLFRISPEENKRTVSKEYIGKPDETPKEKKMLPNLYNIHAKEEDKKTAASKNNLSSPPRPIKIENKDGEYFIRQDGKEMNGKSPEAEKQKKDDKYNLYQKLMENYQAKMGEVNKKLKMDESGSKNFGPIDLTKGETNSKEKKNVSENFTDKSNNSSSKPEEKASSKMSLEPLLKVPQYAQNFKNSAAKDWPPLPKNLSPNDLTQAFLHLKHLDAINQFNPNTVLEQFAKKTGNLDLLYQQKIDFIRRLKRHQQTTEDSTPEKKQKFSPSADKRHSPTSDAKEKTKPTSEEVAALKNAEDLKTLSRIQDLLEIQRAVTQNFKMPPALLQFYSRPRPYPPPIPPNLSSSQTHSPSHPKSQNLGSTSRSLALPMPNASLLDSPNYGHLLSASGIHTEMSFHQTFKNYLRRQEETPQLPNLPLLKKLPRLKEEPGKSISDKHHNSKAPAAKQEPTESLDTPET